MKFYLIRFISLYKYALQNEIDIKVERRTKIRNRYNQVPYLTRNTNWESDMNTRKQHTSLKRAKRSAFSQQVTTRLQGTDKTA